MSSPPFGRHTVTIGTGHTHPYDAREWADALVVVVRGEVLLVGQASCLLVRRGDLLWLTDLSLRELRNDGIEDAVLLAVSRLGCGADGDGQPARSG